ncbi:MAG: DNA-processing protein DprA [Pseudomonadota bacterium]
MPAFDQPDLSEDRPGRAEAVAWLRLARSRQVGPATFRRLIARFGTAAAALDALPELAAAAGREGYRAASAASAAREVEAAEAVGARLLRLGHPGYPPALAEIADAPPVLWARGDAARAAAPSVALVGARNASALGLRLAADIAAGIGAAGLVTVSGLARGIDTAVHRASLGTGTVAVLAGGLDCPYPAENAALAEAVAEGGLLLSEAPMGLAPQARHFPKRNRIISGLARAVLLIEAAERSGSLITARQALDQGREVMAVPGNPLDPRAAGCNRLIRDGAALIRSAEDVLEALETPALIRAPVRAPAATPAAITPAPDLPAEPAPTGQLPTQILNLLTLAPTPEDTLIRRTGAPAAAVLEALTELELDGHVTRHPGGLLSRSPG